MKEYSSMEYRQKIGQKGIYAKVDGRVVRVEWGDPVRTFNVMQLRMLAEEFTRLADFAQENGGTGEVTD